MQKEEHHFTPVTPDTCSVRLTENNKTLLKLASGLLIHEQRLLNGVGLRKRLGLRFHVDATQRPTADASTDTGLNLRRFRVGF